LDAAKDYDLAQDFQGGYANGSRNVNLWRTLGGTVAGALAGGVAGGVGRATGAVMGAMIDKEGGAIAGKIIDWYAKNEPSKFGKFANAIAEAASRGPGALAATHYVLQQTNPEYRGQLKAISE
jgi:hypothetical protein